MYDGAQEFGYGGGLDESDMRFTANKLMSKSTVFPDGNYLKAFAEKEKQHLSRKSKWWLVLSFCHTLADK